MVDVVGRAVALANGEGYTLLPLGELGVVALDVAAGLASRALG